MARLYIANCTQQAQDFIYWMRENPRALRINIPIGGQQPLPGDLSVDEIDYIVQQHAVYGLVDVKTIDRSKQFHGTCYSVDKPVSVTQLQVGISHNFQVLEQRGRDIRQEAAVVINNGIEEQVNGQGGPGGYRNLQVEVTEQGKDPTMAENIKVDRTANAPNGAPAGSRRAGARKAA